MKQKLCYIAVVSAGILGAGAGPAVGVGAGGFTTQLSNARALGRANAVVAQVHDASAVTFNPAALTETGATQLSAGITPLFPAPSFTGPGGIEHRAVRSASVLPSFYAASKLGLENWAFGIGASVPFGGSTEWSSDGPLRYVATRSQLQVVDLEPTVAYRVTPKLSLGLGLDYFYSPKLEQTRMINAKILDGPGAPDARSVIDAGGDGWGFSLGALWKPGARHRVGASYSSRVTVEYGGTLSLSQLTGTLAAIFGGSQYSTGGRGKLTYPSSLTVGYGFQATPRWQLECDLEWTGWSSFDEILLEFDETDPTRLSVLNAGNPTPKNWKDVISLAVGTEYELAHRVILRGGYYFYDNPVPNSTFEPSLPDADVHGVTVGLGVPIGGLAVDLAYKSYFFQKRIVENDVGQTAASSIDGLYEITANTMSIGVTASF